MGGSAFGLYRLEEYLHRQALQTEREAQWREAETQVALRYTEFITIPRWRVYLRLAWLTTIALPLIVTAPLVFWWGSHQVRYLWLVALRAFVQHSGPAFVKWGQWLATRRDVFPDDVRAVFEQLWMRARPHSFAHTKRIVEAALGKPIPEIFSEFDTAPVGSGSIAQVHRAKLRETGEVVAVKVCHPKVRDRIALDFACFETIARIAHTAMPSLAWLDLPGTCEQFIRHLALQVDLTVEADNLREFNRLWAKDRIVSFPHPVEPYVTPTVLVESWAEGAHVNAYLTEGKPWSRRLCREGVRIFLHMLLEDNFLHADLHPGNIMVQWGVPTHGGPPSALPPIPDTSRGSTMEELTVLPTGVEAEGMVPARMHMLDCGLVLRFTNQQRTRILNFVAGLARKDPEVVAEAVLMFAPPCVREAVNVEEWNRDFTEAFTSRYKVLRRGQPGAVTEVLTDVFTIVRKHRVRIEADYCHVLFACMVCEAILNRLDPEFDVIAEAKPFIFKGHSAWRSLLSVGASYSFKRSIT